ncbi:DNA mismatch repair protein MutS [Rhynchospora pubera]|uniref:DNA mismatch repair protein n=1 Tax=Rhynchospora pubera TaxID=906938 RepID=A0AAV8AJQ5_9POAL|nr:DNA mismatch repair protein MutS [Rhynchospora pubera]KAJ4733294.1 DNA mismatch repair protein MutS [Rhynchospora pubera]KAJ4745974.1 DNA mismatch repair protein MutS [Rhynchospora pubera]
MSRRLSNGRSPLVRKQSQITAFFSTPPSSNPKSKLSSNPSSDPSPSPSPSTSKTNKKPLLAIPPPSKTPSPPIKPKTPPSAETEPPQSDFVGRRIKVYWPLDKTWYTGQVKSYDAECNKHSIQYDDGEEESIEIEKEKVEWIEEEPPKKLRRLRKLSEKVEIEQEKSGSGECELDCVDDDSSDEDWGKNVEKESSEEVDLEDEEELEEVVAVNSRKERTTSSQSAGKRKKIDVGKMGCAKKFKFEGDEEKGTPKATKGFVGVKMSPGIGSNNQSETLSKGSNAKAMTDNNLTGEAAERFGNREAEKFKFLREGRKDAKGRRPDHVNYDPRTLYLPPDFLKSLSGGQRQWWEFKSQHLDKVLFFKMGKFYELFEMDAHIGARELDLQYMKGEQPHCGFPEKNLSLNVDKLARKGYRVLVVEQTETPEQLEIRRKEMGSKVKVVKREICAVVTKGTLTDGESLLTNPDASYLMSITETPLEKDREKDTLIGICLVDVSTGKFVVGQFEDDTDRHWLCSILSELRPVEIIKPSNTLKPETEKALRNNTREPLVNELVPSLEFWDAEKTIEEVKMYYCSPDGESDALPPVLTDLVRSGNNSSCALSSLGGCLFYLRQAFLDEKLIKCAEFVLLPCGVLGGSIQKYMILDSAALENLEVLENMSGGSSGTLFAQLDHCVTPFGKRLLKRWLARPLYDRKTILERQDAIASFKGVGLSTALDFRKALSSLADMERLLARLFAICEGNGSSAKRAILYEDASKKQLLEFISALRGCQLMLKACSSLTSLLSLAESTLLHDLLTPGRGLPEMSDVLDHFKDAFDWSQAESTGRIIPREGCDVDYDTACNTIKDIKSNLTKYLKEQRKLIGDSSIDYVNVGKDTYLLEVPESSRESVPRNYELQSSKKGYFRYWTPKIKELLQELSRAEEEKENSMKGILHRLIQQFSENHCTWRQLVSVTAELDVLISLAIAGDYYEGPACRPIINEAGDSTDGAPSLYAKSLGHPILRSDSLGKGSFVPNNVKIGGGAGDASFILLTGPNMGGKSTLLRQVCMAVILAQIGADVPAERFDLSLVDRIFVRMGARDHIMAGHSTFLVELTETASMLSAATRNSLVALDELGRGTSTSDGQAIAASVLEYLVRNVQCRGLFSTHYHRLAVDYEKDTKIALCHMACQVGMGEGGLEEVTFLYRLTSGSCPKSYGVNVARLAGIPASVLQKAADKSNEFESTYGKQSSKSSDKISDAMVTVMKSLACVTGTAMKHDRDSTHLEVICKVQKRTSLLISGN